MSSPGTRWVRHRQFAPASRPAWPFWRSFSAPQR